jgi:hypothetical protein
MKHLVKVEGVTGLYKDVTTNTFINMNESEIEQARQRKKTRLRKKEEEQELRSKVDKLYNDVDEMKSMLRQLLEK